MIVKKMLTNQVTLSIEQDNVPEEKKEGMIHKRIVNLAQFNEDNI